MVDWACVNGGIGDDDSDLSFEAEVPGCLADFCEVPESNVEHIVSNNTKINNILCPKCGLKMILKEGKFGVFYGCINFPECKGTKSR